MCCQVPEPGRQIQSIGLGYFKCWKPLRASFKIGWGWRARTEVVGTSFIWSQIACWFSTQTQQHDSPNSEPNNCRIWNKAVTKFMTQYVMMDEKWEDGPWVRMKLYETFHPISFFNLLSQIFAAKLSLQKIEITEFGLRYNDILTCTRKDA